MPEEEDKASEENVEETDSEEFDGPIEQPAIQGRTQAKGKPRKGPGRSPEGETQVVRVRLPRNNQLLGEVEQLLGDRRMLIRCTDGYTRLCRIPGKIRKRIWIKEGNIVLIEPWQVQTNERGDIVWRYTNQQADWLEKRGHLKGLEQL